MYRFRKKYMNSPMTCEIAERLLLLTMLLEVVNVDFA